MVVTPFNIFKYKENVESMLNESLNQFKFDSTRLLQAFNSFYTFNNVEHLFKRSRHLVQQGIERMLNEILKLSNRL